MRYNHHIIPSFLTNFSQVSKNGLAVSFLGGFDGNLDLVHLKDNGGSGKDLEETNPCKTKV